MAFSVLTPAGLTINIKAMLEAGATIDEVNRQLRGSRGVCLQCILTRRQFSQAQAEGLDRATLEASIDSTFRCGHRRRKWNAQTGVLADATITVEPHYFHPEPWLDEAGEPIQRPCESRSSAHVGFLSWLMGNQRPWCLDGIPDDEATLLLREPRYRNAPPGWRSPDLVVLRCVGIEPEQVLAAIERDGVIPEHATQMISAIELQLSRISVQEIRERTNDHLRQFADVRWVFVERHLAGTGEARKWLAEAGHEAYVIRQEADRSRILGIELLPPPHAIGGVRPPSPPLPCLRSLYVAWLAQGYAAPEALARAKGEREQLRQQAREAIRLNAELREFHGVALPWESPLEVVEQAAEQIHACELQRQQHEARQRALEAEAERLKQDAIRREQEAEALRQASLRRQWEQEQQERAAEQGRQQEIDRRREEELRRDETLWQPVTVIEFSRDRRIVTNVPVGSLLRQRCGGTVYPYLGRDSLGYRLGPPLVTDSAPGAMREISVVYSLEGWQVRSV